MKFTETPLAGAFIVDMTPFEDDRGLFARHWCRREFEQRGLPTDICQINFSSNPAKGTLRGIHYQVPPYGESKFIRCVQGAVYDLMIDLRPESSTYGESFGVELSQDNNRSLFVPAQFGHGYLTLENNTSVIYHVSEFFTPDAEAGIRFDDPRFQVKWPIKPVVVSEKDRNWPDF